MWVALRRCDQQSTGVEAVAGVEALCVRSSNPRVEHESFEPTVSGPGFERPEQSRAVPPTAQPLGDPHPANDRRPLVAVEQAVYPPIGREAAGRNDLPVERADEEDRVRVEVVEVGCRYSVLAAPVVDAVERPNRGTVVGGRRAERGRRSRPWSGGPATRTVRSRSPADEPGLAAHPSGQVAPPRRQVPHVIEHRLAEVIGR